MLRHAPIALPVKGTVPEEREKNKYEPIISGKFKVKT